MFKAKNLPFFYLRMLRTAGFPAVGAVLTLSILFIICLMPFLFPKSIAYGETLPSNDLLQFRAGSQVIGFGPEKIHIAGMGYLLTEEFVGAQKVAPVASDSCGKQAEQSAKKGAPALVNVSYPDLWDGITVNYRNSNGAMESVYHIQPKSDAGKIRLRYNAEPEIQRDGQLRFNNPADRGYFTITAPVAWQEIDDRKVKVDVAFVKHEDNTIGFKIGEYDKTHSLVIDPTYQWNAFYGSDGYDAAYEIALDGSGNIYVTGVSAVSWGSPLNPHSGADDIVVMKLNSSGFLQWNTFFGSADYDDGYGIALDSGGNIYVTGVSAATWGSPLNPHSGNDDIMVMKLNNVGVRQWHAFYGGGSYDWGNGIAVDSGGNIYVVGSSEATWGSALNPHNGDDDIVVMKLNNSGVRQWHAFYGGGSYDWGYGIALDSGGNIYVTGESGTGWGSPVNPHSGYADIVAMELNNSGVRKWHTFYGGIDPDPDVGFYDSGYGIKVDSVGNIYLAGSSSATWGAPVSLHSGYGDIVVTKLFIDEFTLTAGISGTGSGRIMSDPSGIDCPGECSESFLKGDVVILTAVSVDSLFVSWSGCDRVLGNRCQVAMNSDRKVTATFNAFKLTVTKPVGGTVTGDGIACGTGGTDCTENFAPTTPPASVELTATPDAGYAFGAWTGCTSVSLDKKCIVAMSANKTVSVTFIPNRVTVNVVMSGAANGVVISTDGNIYCGTYSDTTRCAMLYTEPSTSVTLRAIAGENSQFTGWSGACTGALSACTVMVNGPKTVTANFRLETNIEMAKKLVSDLRNTVMSVYNYQGTGLPGAVETPFKRLSEEVNTKIGPELADTVSRIGWIVENVGADFGNNCGTKSFTNPDFPGYTLTITRGCDSTYEFEIRDSSNNIVDEGEVSLVWDPSGSPKSGTLIAKMKTASGAMDVNSNFNATISSGRITAISGTGRMVAPGLEIDFSQSGRKLSATFGLQADGAIFPTSINVSGMIKTGTAQFDGLLNLSSIIWAAKADCDTYYDCECTGAMRPKSGRFEGTFQELDNGAPTGVKFKGVLTGSWTNASTYDECKQDGPTNFASWNGSFNGTVEAPASPVINVALGVAQTGYRKYTLSFSYSRKSGTSVLSSLTGTGTITEVLDTGSSNPDDYATILEMTLTNQSGMKVWFKVNMDEDQLTGNIKTSGGVKVADIYLIYGVPVVKYIDGYIESIL